MKVKRIFAPDMKTAMRRVREEIGPDAVILSNKRVAGGVEVVAAPESEYETAQADLRRKQDERRAEQVALLTQKSSGNPVRSKRAQPAELSREELDVELRRARERIAEASLRYDQPEVGRSSNRQISDDTDDLASILGQHDFVANSSGQDQRIDGLQHEIAQLKEMLTNQLGRQHLAPVSNRQFDYPEQRDATAISPAGGKHKRVLERFGRLGVSSSLSQSIVSGLEPELSLEKGWRNALARFAESLPVSGEELIERGGMIAFVGPTGAGKTTTIGKLAARYVLEHGGAGLALVTTDSYRIAAHEQLKTFGRILDVPVRVVDENNSLEEVLASLRGKQIVLIDTAGMNLRDPSGQEQMDMLSNSGVRMKKLLVMSTSSQRQLLEQAYAMYAPLGLHGCVLTKMDESGSLGEALSLTIEKQLRIAYVTDGQRVPDDIDLAKRKDLVSRAVVLAQKNVEFEQNAPPQPKAQVRSIKPVKKTG